MSFDLKITGAVSNNKAEVDSNNNLKVTGPLTEAQAGFTSLMSEIDAGSVTGSRRTKAVEVSDNFRLRVGQDQPVFNDNFSGNTSINRYNWTEVVSTMTTDASNGFARLNAGSSLASGAVARIQTWRHFTVLKQFTTQIEMNLQFSSLPVTNNVTEWGAFISTGTATPTDGVFFRLLSNGEFRGILNYNGTETQSNTIDFSTLVGANVTKRFLIYIDDFHVDFWIGNVLVATVEIPAGQGQATSSQSLPLSVRTYNSNATSTAQIVRLGAVSVTNGDVGSTKPWPHVQSGQGMIASQVLSGGTSALYTNSLAAGAGAAMTNTTAALGTGIGGQFTTTPTLAAGTDGILMSYQNLAGSASTQGRTLMVTGIRIQGAVTAALTGGPVVYAYSLAYGHTAVSMATTDAGTAKAPRRIPLGFESYAATAAVGVIGQAISMPFASPVPVYPGEFIAVTAKNLGTVTSAGTITVLVTIDGYWE